MSRINRPAGTERPRFLVQAVNDLPTVNRPSGAGPDLIFKDLQAEKLADKNIPPKGGTTDLTRNGKLI